MHEQFIIQSKGALPHWDDETSGHRTLESAMKALPYVRRRTKRELRILRRVEEVVHRSEIQ